MIDALLDVDLPEVDPERAAEDAAADLLAREAGGTKKATAAEQSGEPLITVEEATRRLGPKVMAMLADKFNGELTLSRYPDDDDMLF